MFKKIITILLVFAICFTVVGCNKNPSSSSQYSSETIVEETIVEEVIVETVVSDTESNVESTPTENVTSNNSSQTQTSQQTPPEETENIIPEGGIYTCASKGVVLTAGQEWPESCEEFDTYTYGDYKYVYNKGIHCGFDPDTSEDVFDNTVVGWAVSVLDRTKAVYGEILKTINGEPIVTLGPTKLSSVKIGFATFYNCGNLTMAPEIPNTVVYMRGTFMYCSSLVKAPDIPDGVTTIQNAFSDCTSLVTAPAISSSVTNMSGAFFGCTSLTTAPTIPSSVTDMSGAFSGCTSLTTAPTIPSSVTDMRTTFANCTSLRGTVTINANPSGIIIVNRREFYAYHNCFHNVDMSNITLTGSATKETLNNLGATGQNYTPIP